MVKSIDKRTKDGLQWHVRTSDDQVGGYVIVTGDPGKTDEIAKHFDNPELVAYNREHKTWTGYIDGVKVSACSTGMGCSSTAIALEELIHNGAHTFIRIGTCGFVSEESRNGGYEGVIITGAVRDEGTTPQYVPIEFPAVADRIVTNALADACEERGYNFAEGIAQCKDNYYGQQDPDSMPVGDMLKMRWKAWQMAGVMASEMETSALFVVSSVRGARAGAIMSYGGMNDHTIELGCEAIRKLIRRDKAKS